MKQENVTMLSKRVLRSLVTISTSLIFVTACSSGIKPSSNESGADAVETDVTTTINSASNAGGYSIQPGDKLEISVYGEDDLQKELTVGPGGGITFPLIGDINAKGKTVDQLRSEVKEKLAQFIPQAAVSVSIKEVIGNKVHVLGQVKSPGEYILTGSADVMQALSMAGGVTAFAALRKIKILRRDSVTQAQSVIGFNYSDVIKGKNLGQNILLHSGDTVVVP
jgi:polysaccharide export outer membrane protein